MVKISIVVPVYNASAYIGKCIDSILAQTYTDFELLLINDGSSDNSLDVLEGYAKKDKRIVVINQKNMGVAATRNKGIKISRGEYITFIDNDDYIDSDYLEKFLDNTKDSPDVVIGGYRRTSSDDRELYKFTIRDSEWSKYTFITPWGRIIRRKFLLDNNICFFSYPLGEDIYFNLKIYSLSKNIVTISYIGYNWFYNEDSVSNTLHRSFNDKIDIIYFLNKIYLSDDLNKYVKYFYYKFGIWYLLYSGRYSRVDKFMIEYKRIKKWNKDNGIFMNIFPFSKILRGESFKNRVSVFIFYILDKLHLIKLFAIIYCKDK